MVICSVYGCSNRTGRDVGVRFYCFPTITKFTAEHQKALVLTRRSLWLLRLCRQDLDDEKVTKKDARVCSYHFVSGAPAALNDISNPDWAPTQHLGHDFFEDKRKLRKREKIFIPNCQCNSAVPCLKKMKYKRKYRDILKQQISDDNVSGTHKYVCCVMHDAEDSEDSQIERSMSPTETAMSDTSEPSNDLEGYTLITIKPKNSTNNDSVTHFTVTSEDACTRTVQSEDASSKTDQLEDSYSRTVLSKDSCNATIQSEDASSTYISTEDVHFKTAVATKSDEASSTAVNPEDNFSDDDGLESELEDSLYENPNQYSKRMFSELTSEPKNINASGQISCVTHAEAFSASETLLRYMMNQDEVNDVDVNSILSLAQKIKERIN